MESRLEVSGVRVVVRVEEGGLCVELSGTDEQVDSSSDDGGDCGGAI